MDLSHRLADKPSQDSIDVVFHKLKFPLTFVIPLSILLLGFFSVWPYFGDSFKTGTLSLVFLPFIGETFAKVVTPEDNVAFSTIVLAAYVLGSITTYFFVYMVTKRHLTATLTSFLTLLPFMPFTPAPPERLLLAVSEYDAGHIIAFMITPILLWFYLQYLKKGDKNSLIISIVLAIIIALISFFSFYLLLIFFLFLVLSEILINDGQVKIRRFMKSIGGILLVTIGIYNISLLKMVVSSEGRSAIAVFVNLLPMCFFIVPVTGTFMFLIFDRRPQLQPLFLALTYSLVFGLLNFVRIFVVDISVFDQTRYAPEANFAFGFFIAIVITWIFDLLRQGFITKRNPLLFQYRVAIAFGFALVVLGTLVSSVLFIERGI